MIILQNPSYFYFSDALPICLFQDEPIQGGGCDGSFGNRRLFRCPPNCGLFAPMNDIIKHEDFLFANPGLLFALLYFHIIFLDEVKRNDGKNSEIMKINNYY